MAKPPGPAPGGGPQPAPQPAPNAIHLTLDELSHAAAFHFEGFVAKPGKEKELLDYLIQTSNSIQTKDGKAFVTIFQRVHGDGPTHLLVLKAKNPAALKKLSTDQELRDHGTHIKGLVSHSKNADFSEAAKGKLGR